MFNGKAGVWEEPELKKAPLVLGALMKLFGSFIEMVPSISEETCDDQGLELVAFRVLKVDGTINLL